MVKIIGPLHSDSASGGLASVLTFSNRKSGPQVRFQRKQKDVITTLRTAQRSKFSLAISWWNLLDSSEKQEWNVLTN
jgi:hypothetical protein